MEVNVLYRYFVRFSIGLGFLGFGLLLIVLELKALNNNWTMGSSAILWGASSVAFGFLFLLPISRLWKFLIYKLPISESFNEKIKKIYKNSLNILNTMYWKVSDFIDSCINVIRIFSVFCLCIIGIAIAIWALISLGHSLGSTAIAIIIGAVIIASAIRAKT